MNEKIWKVGLYARLSCEDGDKTESESISSQREIVKAYIKDRDDLVLVTEYVDDGYSGVNFDRPGFKKMIEAVKNKTIDCIICKDLSRFARNYIDAGRYLEKIFPFMGIRFIAINDNYDSMSDRAQSDALIVSFKNLINDAYCKDISVKVRSQLDIKRRMGDYVGAFVAYGYRKDPANKNKLLIDEEAAQVVELIYRLRLQGVSLTKTADKLNDMGILSPMEYKRSKGMPYRSGFCINEKAIWSPHAVQRILTNEIYIGTLIQHKRGTPNYKIKKAIDFDRKDWVIIENNHEPIISRVDFDTIQSLLSRDARIASGSETAHLFSGYVYCGDCHRQMHRNMVPSGGKQYFYYVCPTFRNRKGCTAHSFSEKKLKKIVLGVIQDHVRQICDVDRLLDYIAKLPEKQREIYNFDRQLDQLHADIERFKRLKGSLYGDMKDGIVSREEYTEFCAGYDRKIQSRQHAMVQLQEERKLTLEQGTRNIAWIELFKQYENINDLHRLVIVHLLDRIIIYDTKRIEVVFRYQDQLDSALQYIKRFSDIIDVEKEA